MFILNIILQNLKNIIINVMYNIIIETINKNFIFIAVNNYN